MLSAVLDAWQTQPREGGGCPPPLSWSNTAKADLGCTEMRGPVGGGGRCRLQG